MLDSLYTGSGPATIHNLFGIVACIGHPKLSDDCIAPMAVTMALVLDPVTNSELLVPLAAERKYDRNKEIDKYKTQVNNLRKVG